MRIGQGFDVHAFDTQAEPDSKTHITLGGVRIPHTFSLIAHSDGDVLLHALCDALLGALALGDIGVHFPDTDPQYRNINSVQLLEQCFKLVKARGFTIANLDTTIIAQTPKMQPYIEDMRRVIAKTLNTDISEVSVKATTTERLGFCGREEGIACLATVLLAPTVG